MILGDTANPLTSSFESDTIPFRGWTMKGKIDEYRPGKWRIRVYWNGKRYNFYRYPDGTPLMAKVLATRLQERINSEIDTHSFDPVRYTKRRPFNFLRACEVWMNSSGCGEVWKRNRKWSVNKWIIPYWSSYDIRDIRSIDIQEFHVHLKNQNIKDKTIYNIMTELKNMLRFHADVFDKFPNFPRLSYQLPEIRWLESEDQEKILKYIPERDLPIFNFLRFTGCRPSEACGLLRENVNWQQKTFTISTAMTPGRVLKLSTKTKQIRILPIIAEIEDSLRPRHLGNFVFMKQYRNELIPYSVKILEKLWWKANHKALQNDGIRKINLYNAFRHSFACQRLNSGSSMETLREVLGHRCVETTRRYAQYKVTKLMECMRGKVINLVVENGLREGRAGESNG